MAATLSVDIKCKYYQLNGGPLEVLGHNSFEVQAGEFVSLLGPSGCGKTTLLRLILGLDQDYEGVLTLDQRPIKGPGLDRGAVFQEPRLLPWLNVHKNIRFAVPAKAQDDQHRRVDELIRLVGLYEFRKVWPNQLSGGMAQRVALARALVNVPEVLVLDEPFGALDSITRMRMQDELLRVLAEEPTTTLLVTHDIDEAVYLSDRILIMTSRPGRVVEEVIVEPQRPRKRNDPLFTQLRADLMNRFYNLIGQE